MLVRQARQATGPKGETGAAGPVGATGPQGPKGDPGGDTNPFSSGAGERYYKQQWLVPGYRWRTHHRTDLSDPKDATQVQGLFQHLQVRFGDGPWQDVKGLDEVGSDTGRTGE